MYRCESGIVIFAWRDANSPLKHCCQLLGNRIYAFLCRSSLWVWSFALIQSKVSKFSFFGNLFQLIIELTNLHLYFFFKQKVFCFRRFRCLLMDPDSWILIHLSELGFLANRKNSFAEKKCLRLFRFIFGI